MYNYMVLSINFKKKILFMAFFHSILHWDDSYEFAYMSLDKFVYPIGKFFEFNWIGGGGGS